MCCWSVFWLVVACCCRYMNRPVMSRPGLYDPTTIMNANELSRGQKEGWIKLAFYIVSFFYYLYRLVFKSAYLFYLQKEFDSFTVLNSLKTLVSMWLNIFYGLSVLVFVFKWSWYLKFLLQYDLRLGLILTILAYQGKFQLWKSLVFWAFRWSNTLEVKDREKETF